MNLVVNNPFNTAPLRSMSLQRRGNCAERMNEPTFSSSITQGAHSGCPIDIAPKIGIETLNPLFPSCTYSALLFSTESKRDLGGVGVAILLLSNHSCFVL